MTVEGILKLRVEKQWTVGPCCTAFLACWLEAIHFHQGEGVLVGGWESFSSQPYHRHSNLNTLAPLRSSPLLSLNISQNIPITTTSDFLSELPISAYSLLHCHLCAHPLYLTGISDIQCPAWNPTSCPPFLLRTNKAQKKKKKISLGIWFFGEAKNACHGGTKWFPPKHRTVAHINIKT